MVFEVVATAGDELVGLFDHRDGASAAEERKAGDGVRHVGPFGLRTTEDVPGHFRVTLAEQFMA